MNEWSADVAVVGVGIWGASALWALASRGLDVLGVERFQPGHGFGSSLGGSRMFRLTGLDHPGLVPLARHSQELWRCLEKETGTSLLRQSGALLIGPRDGQVAGSALRDAREHGIEVHVLERGEMQARFPRHAKLADHEIALWEPTAGILRAEDSVRAAATAAVQAGARLLTDTRVHAVDLVDDGVVVRTQARDLHVHRVVLTVGCWLPAFAPTLPLHVVRHPIAWFESDGHTGFDLDQFPMFVRELANGTALWGNGRESGRDIKLGIEAPGQATLDPDIYSRAVIAADWQPLADLLPSYLPGLKPLPSQVALSMKSQTPDRHFIIGFLDDDRRIIVAGGCNGHGFKHSTGIGEVIADMVEDVKPRFPLEFASPTRFSQ